MAEETTDPKPAKTGVVLIMHLTPEDEARLTAEALVAGFATLEDYLRDGFLAVLRAQGIEIVEAQ